MKNALGVIQNLEVFQKVVSKIQEGESQNSLGLGRAARLPVLTSLHQSLRRPTLLITQKTDHALTLLDELALWAPKSHRLYFPEPTSSFYENAAWGENTRRERLLTLSTLAASQIPGVPKPDTPPIVIAPARAVMARTLPLRDFVKASESIKIGQTVSPGGLVKKWLFKGYHHFT